MRLRLVTSAATKARKVPSLSLSMVAQSEMLSPIMSNVLFRSVRGFKSLWTLSAVIMLLPLALEAQTPRERVSFNADWRFTKDDPAVALNTLNYSQLQKWINAEGAEFAKDLAPATRPAGKPGGDVPCAQPGFDDSGWRKLNLPHDWGIEGPFNQEYPGNTGKLPFWGVGWYRKQFEVSSADQGRRLYLDVDGAMSRAAVWINGAYAGGWPYGYASWRVDLTPHVKFGGTNVIAIRLDNPPESSRWYPGGGIYRNVWLVKTPPIHVAQWGTYITTPSVSPSAATVRVRVNVQNDSAADTVVTIRNELCELNGEKPSKPVASLSIGDIRLAAGKSGSAQGQILFNHPHLWSVRDPQRYLMITSVEQDGKVLDRYETPFGIRSIQFDADKGFFLNGERVQIKGVCNHHDLGALGAAFNIRAAERQLQILQEMGVNAIRTSHNPPAPELLDLCDRMGFLVMDEAFDCWKGGKTKQGYQLLYPDWHEKDLRAQIRRDRNHPCVILWSTGNEVREQANPEGHAISAELTRIVHDEDPTRPAAAGCNNAQAGYNGFQKTVDVFGYNYKPGQYARVHATNAGLPILGSETSSCISSRGEYFFPVTTNKNGGQANFQISSYDLYSPGWGCPPDVEFKAQDEFPFVAGEFVWTGFDYLGEPTPYNNDASNLLNFSDPAEQARLEKELRELGKIRVPSRSSYFGIVDLAGFKKDRFYSYQAHWRPDFPMAHILPHWNWPERTGQVTPVHVYSSGDEAELFLNDQSLGRKKRGPGEYRFRWDDVVYQPGTLKVVTYKSGKKWATDVMKTTGAAAQLSLEADRGTIAADGADLCFVTLKVADKNGLTVPRSKNHIRFKVSGPGELVATDNGDPTSFESFQSPGRNAFNGLALAIVRAKPGQPGTIKVEAESEGLKADSVAIRAR